MLCLQRPHNFWCAWETLPQVIVFDFLHGRVRQIPQNAFLAEDIGTAGAAIHVASLATPATVQLAAIFPFVEFSTVVKCVAFFAVRHTQNGMHSDDFLAARSGADVTVARRTMNPSIGNHINVGIWTHIILLFIFCEAWLEFQFKPCE